MKIKNILSDSYVTYGIILLLVSALLYVVYDITRTATQLEPMGAFMVHYAITVLYFFAILLAGRLAKGRNGLPLVVINLLMFLISAYALNREMNVFHQAVPWMQVLLVLVSVNMLVTALGIEMPLWAKRIQWVLMTVGLLLFLYLAIYLLPLYPISLLGILAIGLGLHAFVPLLLVVYGVRMYRIPAPEAVRRSRMAWLTTALVLVTVTVFAFRWNAVQTKQETVFLSATKPGKIAWPAWAETLEQLPNSTLTRNVLKADLVYTVPLVFGDWDFFDLGGLRWEEARKHDPLVMIASLFSGKNLIPMEDRIRMLQVLHDNRYGAEERLWSGRNLQTLHINTEVQIWPAMHLAYAEKTITVANTAPPDLSGRNQQEAIYLFQLPEGAVVSSLSLWINGKEEKSVLTTKGKATEAYRAIVGREFRDPSLVHWQEGNRVSVRVFPVPAGGQRIFKLGITIPMPERAGRIWYEQFTFLGPSAENATENATIRLEGTVSNNVYPVALIQQDTRTFTYEGRYNPGMSFSLKAGPVLPHTFTYEGVNFTVESYQPHKEPVLFTEVYADINRAWTKEEWQQLRNAVGTRTLYVYDGKWIAVQDENANELFDRLGARSMTLFPFYKMPAFKNRLVVTKAAGKTPFLSDMKESAGYDALIQKAANGNRVYLYQLASETTGFIAGLREFRMFHFAHGNMQQLAADLQKGYYAADAEQEDVIVLHQAGLQIHRHTDGRYAYAPDHVMRLFAYNYIMQQGGTRMLADTALQAGNLAELARYAHIVTPLTSMVVLESQQDYDRFKIDTNAQGLQNAGMQQNGAVPEPHEWALIIVLVLLCVCYRFHQIKQKLWFVK